MQTRLPTSLIVLAVAGLAACGQSANTESSGSLPRFSGGLQQPGTEASSDAVPGDRPATAGSVDGTSSAPSPGGEDNPALGAGIEPGAGGDGATSTSEPSAGSPDDATPSADPGDGAQPGGAAPLPRSTPEAEGVRSGGVQDLVQALDAEIDEVHSVMLVRHGQVIAEGFWAPYAPTEVHVLYSGTKSFNATAVGFAAQEGLLSVDDTVLSHFPDLAPAEPAAQMQTMRISHLLSMASGHQNDTMDTLRARADGQWTRAFLETDVENPPGSLFVYNSGASYMLASIVQRVTGMTVEEYLEPRLFAPLGIERHIWGQSPEGVDLAGGGLAVTTEAFAKFGQLYLDRGEFGGQRLLSEDWVDAASSKQIATGNDDSNWGYGYGYQFWRNARGGYRADGSLGQFAFILPEQDVVLVVTSATNDTDGVMNRVWEHLLPAIESDDPLPRDPAANQALETTLAGLSLPLPRGSASSPMAADVSGRRYAAGGNSQGIRALTLTFAATPTLTIEDGDGTHAIALGVGEWQRGRTGFKRRINELFDTPEQAIAASGAWESDDTFVARLAFNETPYVMTARFRFQGEQALLDVSYNVRWGNSVEPQIVATR